MKKYLAVLLASLAVALGAIGCSSSSRGYYDTICVDPLTQNRMPDYYCVLTTGYSSYYNSAWLYYVPYGYSAPAFGGHITNYTVNNYHAPTNAVVHTGGVPSSGGKAPKLTSGNTTVKPSSNPTVKPATTKANPYPNGTPKVPADKVTVKPPAPKPAAPVAPKAPVKK